MLRPKTVNQGSTLSASEFNRLTSELKRLSGITARYPLELTNVGSNPQLRWIDTSIHAVILGSSSSSSSSCSQGPTPYAWQEVQPLGNGTWSVLDRGRSGSTGTNPAYEANGNCVEPGTVVLLRPGLNGEYVFFYCCSGSGVMPSSSSSSSSASSLSSGSVTSSLSSGSVSSSSVSSSSSGSVNFCCPDGSPNCCPSEHPTLYGTVVTATNCSCIAGHVYTLTWDGANSRYVSDFVNCGSGDAWGFALRCIDSGSWQFAPWCHPNPVPGDWFGVTTHSCDPLQLEFTFGGLNLCGSCGSFPGAVIDITITE